MLSIARNCFAAMGIYYVVGCNLLAQAQSIHSQYRFRDYNNEDGSDSRFAERIVPDRLEYIWRRSSGGPIQLAGFDALDLTARKCTIQIHIPWIH